LTQQVPTISIVTPSLNQATFLEATIRSVLDQAYPSLEYVVIDGGSNDGSLDVISKYATRLSYWESERDRGHGHALNKGFSHTTGEIMAWLNSDDKYFPWTLSVVGEVFSQFPEVEWIMGTNACWDERDRVVLTRHNQKNIYDFLLGRYGWIQQESVFWRRSLWERAGGYIDENYRFMVDGELWCRFFLEAKLWSVSAVLGGWRGHDANRGIVHHSECLAEMARALTRLEERCPERIRRAAQQLKWITRLRGDNGVLRAIAARLMRRLFKRALLEAAYSRITFDFGSHTWKQERTSFPV